MKNKPKIVLISGKARAGKDTFATLFKEIADSNNEKSWIINYADLVKYVCAKYYNWDGVKDSNGRSLLQKVGTDIGRANNENVWVNCVKELVKGLGKEYNYVLIPDVRFPNEITAWQDTDYDFSTVRISRWNKDGTPFDNELTMEQKKHSSETSLDDYEFDYNIENTNMVEFLGRTKEVYEKIKKEKSDMAFDLDEDELEATKKMNGVYNKRNEFLESIKVKTPIKVQNTIANHKKEDKENNER